MAARVMQIGTDGDIRGEVQVAKTLKVRLQNNITMPGSIICIQFLSPTSKSFLKSSFLPPLTALVFLFSVPL